MQTPLNIAGSSGPCRHYERQGIICELLHLHVLSEVLSGVFFRQQHECGLQMRCIHGAPYICDMGFNADSPHARFECCLVFFTFTNVHIYLLYENHCNL